MKTRIETSGNLPPCSRCHGPLTISAAMPQQDNQGQPIHLELCRSCDTGKEAADALLAWFAAGGGHDPARAPEGARLLIAWQEEAMAVHGWVLATPATQDDVTRLGKERDLLRAQVEHATPDERSRLQERIRTLSGTLASASDTGFLATSGDPRRTPPRIAPPGPLSPEAEQRIRDTFDRLSAEQNRECEHGD
ncbi:DUF6300 family protein [Streptomyces sp. PA03-6a]|nr:DUF6300 family protein [Streptomyces sp. PA03-6a]